MRLKQVRFGMMLAIVMGVWLLVAYVPVQATRPARGIEMVKHKVVAERVRPAPRAGHGMVYDGARGVVVMFGGRGEGGFLADTWEYDGRGWYEVVGGVSPAGRANYGMAYDEVRQTVVLVGGWSDVDGTFSDTWEYHNQVWRLVSLDKPAPEGGWHSMAYDTLQNRMVLVEDRGYVWVYTAVGWENMTAELTLAYECTCICLVAPKVVFMAQEGVFWIENQNSYAQTLRGLQWDFAPEGFEDEHRPDYIAWASFAYDSRRNVVVAVNNQYAGEYVYGEGWRLIDYVVENPTRVDGGMAYDSQRGVTVLFGGRTGAGWLNDLWEFDGEVWVEGARPGKGFISHGDSLMGGGA